MRARLAVGDLVEDAVEVGSGESPLKRRGDLAVLAEGKQPRGELFERVEVRAQLSSVRWIEVLPACEEPLSTIQNTRRADA